MNTLGKNIKITFFGESHNDIIGVSIDGMPPGFTIDEEALRFDLAKRRPKSPLFSERREPDNYEIISGYHQNHCMGAPLTIIIKNTDVKSSYYTQYKTTPRPGHADYPAHIKYQGFNDFRGGGMFSGRLTALWVIVGALSKQILKLDQIYTASHIFSIKDIKDDAFNNEHFNIEHLNKLNASDFPLNNPLIEEKMKTLIMTTKSQGNSIGGIIESVALNLPAGLGEPLFDSFESKLSHALFSVPAVVGVEFGEGFSLTKKYGSETNDSLIYQNGKITTSSHHLGGLAGGLTLGSPLLFKVAIKPTPSISIKQNTIDLSKKETTTIKVTGRHDTSIVPRAVVVINAVLNFVILDLLLSNKRWL